MVSAQLPKAKQWFTILQRRGGQANFAANEQQAARKSTVCDRGPGRDAPAHQNG